MRRSSIMALVLFLTFGMATPVFAAEGGSTLHYFGAAIGLGMVVIGAGLGSSCRRINRTAAGSRCSDYCCGESPPFPFRGSGYSRRSVLSANRTDEIKNS